ncbi:MAG: serine--tRNA ligase, partial [Bifidobacteriaceae bacterium]|nr:serine--tRNA ligase [Bifidobacteriaceae bacterium]
MIDLKLLREDPGRVRASQSARGADPGLVDQILQADKHRREALVAYETARAQQKSLGKLVAGAKGEDKQKLVAQAQELAAQVKAGAAAVDSAEAALT